MAKDYSQGYIQGQEGGAGGDNKLAMRSFNRMFTEVGSWLPSFDNCDAQFRTGY